MKNFEDRMREMFENMDPDMHLYLQSLQENPEKGFIQQVKVELMEIGSNFTPSVLEKIITHYKLRSISADSVYLGMEAKQVNPDSDDFFIINFIGAMEFWGGFFENTEGLDEDDSRLSKRILDILENIQAEAISRFKNKIN
jgi:hypothetical protein